MVRLTHRGLTISLKKSGLKKFVKILNFCASPIVITLLTIAALDLLKFVWGQYQAGIGIQTV